MCCKRVGLDSNYVPRPCRGEGRGDRRTENVRSSAKGLSRNESSWKGEAQGMNEFWSGEFWRLAFCSSLKGFQGFIFFRSILGLLSRSQRKGLLDVDVGFVILKFNFRTF